MSSITLHKDRNKDFKLVETVLYSCSLIYKGEQLFAICTYLQFLLIKVKIKEHFTLKSAPVELFLKLVTDKRVDLNNCILINNMYHKHIINNAKLINIHDSDNINNYRTVTIIPMNLQYNTAIVSYNLLHNLMFDNKNTVKLHFTDLNTQKIATEVELSLISSPTDFNNSIVDELIKYYFQSPKLLYKNDIICINLKQYVPHLVITNLKLNEIDNAYFKCKNICVKNVADCKYGYFCVVGETAIKQGVTIQHELFPMPKMLKNIDELKMDQDYLIEHYPYGLEDYFHELERNFTPFFKRILKVQPVFLLQGSKGSGKNILIEALANNLGVNLFNIPSAEITGNNYMQTEIRIKNCFFRLQLCAPCILHLRNFEQFGKNNEGEYDPRIINYFSSQITNLFQNTSNVVIICSSNVKSINSDLARMFLDTITIKSASLTERFDILRWLTDKDDIDADKETLHTIAQKTNGFFYEDFKTLLYHAMSFRLKENEFKFERKVEQKYFEQGLDLMQNAYNESIGAPKVPKVQWSDIGGLTDVKEEIIKTINLPLKHPDFLKTTGLKRSGILLYGPPGTGKTLMAKAVATECSLCFLSIKGPELLNMYIGQSEQNVREVFEKAREASPCIIFFDELDALAPNRGMSGDSGGVMDRIVSQLLSEMDGINDSGLVFIIGATNRPDLIDPALLRPGRFDKLLYVGPCVDFESKLSVLKALTRKFKLCSDLDLSSIIAECGANVTGADMYGICSGAWLNAAKRIITKAETENTQVPENCEVIVGFQDFQAAVENVKPSVSAKDMEYFDKLKTELSASK